MACDDGELNLTREEALKLHRQMWCDMQTILGDIPSAFERSMFKNKWCEKWCAENNYPDGVMNSCFLCEYADGYCEDCPIDWSKADHIATKGMECADCTDRYYPLDTRFYRSYFTTAAISEILALPEREVSDV